MIYLKNSYILLFIVLLASCSNKKNTRLIYEDSQSSSEHRTEWPQKCEMCGAEWLVTPYDPTTVVPPTVQWCYLDGNVCEVGFDIIKDAMRNKKSSDLQNNRELVNHCLTCKGCRYAIFTPDEWKRVTDAIENIRR